MENDPKNNLPDYSKDPLLQGLARKTDEEFDKIIDSLDSKVEKSRQNLGLDDKKNEEKEAS